MEDTVILTKEEVKERINDLRTEIEYHSNLYYNEESPEISDFEFDKLMRELKKLEEANPELITADSPTQKVGGKVKEGLKKMKHSTPTISLRDVFDKKEVYDFMESLEKKFGEKVEVVVEKKIDGLTIRSIYENGVYKDALSRGDGETGEVLTAQIAQIKDVPKSTLSKLTRLEVRGEAYMTYKAFEDTNALQKSKGEKTYQNPRNLASGTVRQLDPSIVAERNLNMFMFNVEVAEGQDFETHTESLEWLRKEGFKVTPDYKVCKTADEVWDAICEIGESREKLEFPIDGAVVKVNRLDYREEMGNRSKTPRWAIAFKYPPEEARSIMRKVVIQVSRSGRLNPVGIIEPCRLEGTNVEKVTLHNFKFIEDKGINFVETNMPGEYEVLNGACKIRKAGSIIPELVSMIGEKGDMFTNLHVNPVPSKCPECGGEVVEDGDASLICVNTLCPKKVSRSIAYFASKDAMDISGCGQSTVDSLLEHGYIKDIADLYELKNRREDLIESGAIGRTKSVDNLLAAIEKSKENDIDRLITGIGIRNVGRRASKALVRKFSSIDELENASYEDLLDLHEFGEKMATDIIKFLSESSYKDLMNRLKIAGVNTVSKVLESKVDSRFEGMTFVITGTLPTLKREEAASLVESFGGKVSSSVSKKTTYLLAGEKAGSKLTKAESIGVKVIDEDKFKQMIL